MGLFKKAYVHRVFKSLNSFCINSFIFSWPRRGPHQVSKGPQENDDKLWGHSNFWVGHRNFTAWVKYLKFKIETKFPFSPASFAAQKAKLYFIAFPTSYLVVSGFRWVTFAVKRT
jgi:hypothetical protein